MKNCATARPSGSGPQRPSRLAPGGRAPRPPTLAAGQRGPPRWPARRRLGHPPAAAACHSTGAPNPVSTDRGRHAHHTKRRTHAKRIHERKQHNPIAASQYAQPCRTPPVGKRLLDNPTGYACAGRPHLPPPRPKQAHYDRYSACGWCATLARPRRRTLESEMRNA